jgi:hypothetical protein
MTMFAALVWTLLAQGAGAAFSGTVVGVEGEPIVGAELILLGPTSCGTTVLARARSGEGGRFTLDRPAGLAGDHDPGRSPILWAAKPGFRLSATWLPKELPGPNEPFRIVLGPPGKVQVRVEGPDGRAVAGAVVLPGRLTTRDAFIPGEIAEKTSATTGQDGVAVLDAVSPEDLAYVEVRTREYGSQGWRIARQTDSPVVVPLRPVSTWKGRLTAKDPAHVKGWKVRARTGISGIDVAPHAAGHVEAVTDEEGRFTLAPIAVGTLQLDLSSPGDMPVRANVPRDLTVRQGIEGSGEIPLQKPVVVTGRILERGTGKPIADARVDLADIGSRQSQNLMTLTDADGRYTLHALPGKLRVSFLTLPPSHVAAPGPFTEDIEPAEGVGPVELAPREVLRAAPALRGEVRDEAGRIVAGADVQIAWRAEVAGTPTSHLIHMSSDAAGGFDVTGMPPDAAVTIMASHRGRRTQPPLEIRSGVEAPVNVVVSPMPLAAAVGKLTAPAGTRLGGIQVRIAFRPGRGAPEGLYSGRFALPLYAAITSTRPDGSYETPKEIERMPGEFCASVYARDFRRVDSEWIPTPDGELLRFPDLALTPTRATRVVEGRVVDREGKPVAGAMVSQAGDTPTWTFATTEADGRYRLDGVLEGESLVFAEAAGFRFGGAVVDGNEAVEIRLARRDEPPLATPKPLPSTLSRAEERAMAREYVRHMMSTSRPASDGVDARAATLAFARVNAEYVLDKNEGRAIRGDDAVVGQAILGRFEDAPNAAIATIQANPSPASRAAGWLALERYRPAIDRGRREDFLEKALADARQVAEPGPRIRLLGRIADRWLERGSLDKARPMLLKGRDVLAGAPPSQRLQEAEAFAEALAVIDLPTATAIFERRGKTNVNPPDAAATDRHKAGAAVRIARFHPEEAAALMPSPSSRFDDRPAAILAAARRMAHADPDRAARFLESNVPDPQSITPAALAFVPFGLGAMADDLAEADPERARALLDEAFAGLRQIASGHHSNWELDSLPSLMAELLPVVERVDPDRLAERIWLLAASRSSDLHAEEAMNLLEASATAALVARYDHKMADVIAASVMEHFSATAKDTEPDLVMAIVRNLTVYDPRAIPRLLRSLPDSARKPQDQRNGRTFASIEDQVRLAAAQVLGVPPEARPAEIRPSAPWRSPYLVAE